MENSKYHLDTMVEEMVQNFLKNNFSNYPTCDQILDKLDLKITEASPFKKDQDAFFDIVNGIIVLNNKITYQPRKTFTIFHEITHKLIADNEEISKYLTELFLNKPSYQSHDYTELLCNIGAAEFLIPSSTIKDDFVNNGFSISSFQFLKNKYNASAQAFVIKFARSSPVDCVCLSCIYEDIEEPPNEEQNKLIEIEEKITPKCHIEFWSKSKNFKYLLKKNTIIPNDHLIKFCLDSKQTLSDKTFFPFASGKKMPCYGECFYENGRIFSILYKDDPINSNKQATLF